ncbi:helix-turn-helix domain-containing protein [Saccharopolyspora sp. TS4A08]|uniref:Helix-turn-helix domain-containing protein n=1 Tax=Saccharopolyspora ipomoeae TaxID=3042027 RepID=A0ABT6PHT7_9PSEU|nr:helix-turn-helix domain-containing protein [Saccharopolyspora sp. TS4A08]MDI2027524.1 helix-turn-helix domain-containing protein [Saccharopolyspora sp. TS4A08]
MHTPLHVPVTPGGPLRRLVHSCLDDLDELVAVFLAELRSMEPYASDAVPWIELREHAEASMELLLRLVGGMPMPDRLADLCERIGRSRAQAGVPLEVLLHAVRFDFRVLWDAFTRRASDDELPSLVHSASRVWAAVDHHTTRIHLAYLAEAAVVAREQEHERAQLVARLLTTDARDPQVVAQVATALDVSADADFAVAAAPLSATRPLRDTVDELTERGIAVHLQDVDRRPVLIAQLPSGTTAVPSRWLHDVPCGLAPVARTLAGVPRAVRIAAELAGTEVAEAGPRGLTDAWASVVAGRLGETGDALAAEVFGRVRGIGAGERARLLETAACYLRTGSAGAVAAELYCHRNTVLNRLRRIAELTGCDLTRPEQAALFAVARECGP